MAKDAERQKWEYLTHSIKLADLKQLGEDGWELITLFDDRHGDHPGHATAVFKRPKA